MKHKTLELDCPELMASALARAVRAYAEAAFPVGGSECAQVSRQTLLDAATTIAGHTGGPLLVRKRQIAQLRAATNWYFHEVAPDQATIGDSLRALLAKR